MNILKDDILEPRGFYFYWTTKKNLKITINTSPRWSVWKCCWLTRLAHLSACTADHLAPTAGVGVTGTVGAAKVIGAAGATGFADAAKAIEAAGAAKAATAVRAAGTAGTGKPAQHCGNVWTAGSLRTRRGQWYTLFKHRFLRSLVGQNLSCEFIKDCRFRLSWIYKHDARTMWKIRLLFSSSIGTLSENTNYLLYCFWTKNLNKVNVRLTFKWGTYLHVGQT